MNGLIGKKVGMTSVYDAAGKYVACTVIEAEPNVVTQTKNDDGPDRYNAIQLAFGQAKVKSQSKAILGHLAKAKAEAKRKIVEFRDFDLSQLNGSENGTITKETGDTISLDEVFKEGDTVHVVGTSKGKGFQGVVKRHGFRGVNDATHGQHNRQRAPGSIGAASYPSKVFKGMRMAGRMGGTRVKMKNLKVVKIFSDKNLILIKGSVPGHKGSVVIIEK